VRFQPPSVALLYTSLLQAREASTVAGDEAWSRVLAVADRRLCVGLRILSKSLASFDALNSLAQVALLPGYVRPKFATTTTTTTTNTNNNNTDNNNNNNTTPPRSKSTQDQPGRSSYSGTSMVVLGARHPTVERFLEAGAAAATSSSNGGRGHGGGGGGGGGGASSIFVPNDVSLSVQGGPRAATVVTGPNMGGKSCYVRSVALVALMGQLGSFVPAQQANLVVLDGIFTRMGADDDLARGEV
jgi:DNA mismatch repair protein MSH3